jgi:hypothetical protein
MCLLSSYLIVPFMIHFAGPRAVSFQTQALTFFACLLRYGDVLGNWHQSRLYLFLFKVIFLTLAFINIMSLSAAKYVIRSLANREILTTPSFLVQMAGRRTMALAKTCDTHFPIICYSGSTPSLQGRRFLVRRFLRVLLGDVALCGSNGLHSPDHSDVGSTL